MKINKVQGSTTPEPTGGGKPKIGPIAAVAGGVVVIGLVLALVLIPRGNKIDDNDTPLGGTEESQAPVESGAPKANDLANFTTFSGLEIDDPEIVEKMSKNLPLTPQQEMEVNGGEVAKRTGIPTSKWDLRNILKILMENTNKYIYGQAARTDAPITGELMPQLIAELAKGNYKGVPVWKEFEYDVPDEAGERTHLAVEPPYDEYTYHAWSTILGFIMFNDVFEDEETAEFEAWTSMHSNELVSFIALDIWDFDWDELSNFKMRGHKDIKWEQYDINYSMTFNARGKTYTAIFGNMRKPNKTYAKGVPGEYVILDVVEGDSELTPGILDYLNYGEAAFNSDVEKAQGQGHSTNENVTSRVEIGGGVQSMINDIHAVTEEEAMNAKDDINRYNAKPSDYSDMPDGCKFWKHDYIGEIPGYKYSIGLGYFPEGGNVTAIDGESKLPSFHEIVGD